MCQQVYYCQFFFAHHLPNPAKKSYLCTNPQSIETQKKILFFDFMKEPLDFVAIDLETANFQRSSICEFGLAVVRDSKIVCSKSWLIRPKNNIYNQINISVHGITPNMTDSCPSFTDVWPEISQYLEGQLVVSHNTAFDMYALRDALDTANISYPNFRHMCSLRLSRKIFESRSYGIEALTRLLNIDMGTHHRAGDDACSCANIFIKAIEASGLTLDELQENYGCGEFISGIDIFVPQRIGDVYHPHKQTCLKTNIPPSSSISKDNFFAGKSLCITGTLTCGQRSDILQYIEEIGGLPTNTVTKKTDVLIVGMKDYRVVNDTGMSGKQRKANELRDNGQNIEILSEKEFLELLNEYIIS